MPYPVSLRKLLLIPAIVALAAACRKDGQEAPPPPTGPVTQQEINNWILDSMRYFYLWNEQLPAQADSRQETMAFFNSLKAASDQFSQIYNPDSPATITKYLLYTYGFDFVVIPWPQAPGGALGIVRFVMPGSLAADAGLKRGDYFTHINQTLVSAANAVNLGEQLLQQESGSLTRAVLNGNSVTSGETVSLQAGPVGEYPIHALSTWDVSNKKVGYLFYNYFNDNNNSDLAQAFRQFRTDGVTELILDMRYNPGGSVAAAAMLTALIAPGVNEQSSFVQYTGNARLGQRMISFRAALSVPQAGNPIIFSDLASGRLSLPRVFILCGRQTASAAELVINNLKPYTQVITIGQATFGKDKGAVTVHDARSPKRIPWVMLPIAYRLANASGEGNYTQGIAPQYAVDELGTLPLLPIGDTRDPLIAKAITIIDEGSRQIPGAVTGTPVLRYYDSQQAMAASGMVCLPASLVR